MKTQQQLKKLTARSAERILKILTQKWLQQKITDYLYSQNALFAELKSQNL